jgi:hypothetical protein
MKETYVYREHSIELDLSDIACDRIRWTYFIDGTYCIQGVTDSCCRDRVRIDALALAHRSIDFLDSMRSGSGNADSSRAIDPCLVSTTMDRRPRRIAADSLQGSPG